MNFSLVAFLLAFSVSFSYSVLLVLIMCLRVCMLVRRSYVVIDALARFISFIINFKTNPVYCFVHSPHKRNNMRSR